MDEKFLEKNKPILKRNTLYEDSKTRQKYRYNYSNIVSKKYIRRDEMLSQLIRSSQY